MPQKLTPQDYQNAAKKLGVSVAHIKAVTAVESQGGGFLADGRPKILFERHVFRKRLIEKGVSVQNTPNDIVNAASGGYQGGVKEHDRLARAAKIDRDAALESASWGLFQIMGYHWKTLGYASLQTFINEMYRDEGGQLDAFIRFILADPRLLRALKNQDWASFARIYNGPGYAANRYDVKMADEFKRAGGTVA